MKHKVYLLGLGITCRDFEINYLDYAGSWQIERVTVYKDDEAYQQNHSQYDERERANQLACSEAFDFITRVEELQDEGYKIVQVWRTGEDDPEQGITLRMEKIESEEDRVDKILRRLSHEADLSTLSNSTNVGNVDSVRGNCFHEAIRIIKEGQNA